MIYSEDEKALIFISHFDFMTSAKMEKVLSYLSNPKDIFTLSSDELFKFKDELKKNYEVFVDGITKYDESKFFDTLERKGIRCLTIISDNYPKRLLGLKNPPYVLYYCGNIDLINTNGLAIVGTRNPTNYGKTITENFAKTLAENGITIVSGLATGVDKIAHESALEVGGNTIAVLGGGFDHMFPAMNINLAREIAKKGLVLTEYYFTARPTKYSFPTRNRIIAGLSKAVLITEASAKSGSLYTKDYADDLGLSTYAIPGNITSEKSEATNRLIKAGVAYPATRPEDVLLEYGIRPQKENKKKSKKDIQLTVEESAVLELLKDGERDFEYLLEKTNLSVQTLNYNLTTMEIRGIIKKLAGNTYMLIG